MQKHQELFVVSARLTRLPRCSDGLTQILFSIRGFVVLFGMVARELPTTPSDQCTATFEELPALVKWTAVFLSAHFNIATIMNGSETRDEKLIILMPVYNDWEALSLLLPLLDRELKAGGLAAGIVLVDDASTTASPKNFAALFEAIATIDVLSLRRNLGHQRAIAVGLSYIEANHPQSSVVVMDSDGQDDPKDVPRLIQKCVAHRGEKIVFAARTKRSEGWIFTFFYHLYRLIHFLLIGVRVRVGNFSVVPPRALKRLVAVSELWNHYAAAVHKAKLPMEFIPSERATRLAGHRAWTWSLWQSMG